MSNIGYTEMTIKLRINFKSFGKSNNRKIARAMRNAVKYILKKHITHISSAGVIFDDGTAWTVPSESVNIKIDEPF